MAYVGLLKQVHVAILEHNPALMPALALVGQLLHRTALNRVVLSEILVRTHERGTPLLEALSQRVNPINVCTR